MDTYNDSADLYRKHLRREPYYSFNYGSVHFIVLDTTDPGPGTISAVQRAWLEADLEQYRYAPAIFALTHHSLLPPSTKLNAGGGAAEILSLLEVSRNAVFSGQPRGRPYGQERRHPLRDGGKRRVQPRRPVPQEERLLHGLLQRGGIRVSERQTN